jgi:hypothetical protein
MERRHPSEAFVVELLNLYEDVGHRIAAMDRELAALSKTNHH